MEEARRKMVDALWEDEVASVLAELDEPGSEGRARRDTDDIVREILDIARELKSEKDAGRTMSFRKSVERNQLERKSTWATMFMMNTIRGALDTAKNEDFTKELYPHCYPLVHYLEESGSAIDGARVFGELIAVLVMESQAYSEEDEALRFLEKELKHFLEYALKKLPLPPD